MQTAPGKSCPRELRCAAPESDALPVLCPCRKILLSAHRRLLPPVPPASRAPPEQHLSCSPESRLLFLCHFRQVRRCRPSSAPDPPRPTDSSPCQSAARAES